MNESERPDPLRIARLEVFSQPAPTPGRVNEDAWLLLDQSVTSGTLVAAVVDGATQRVPLPALSAYLQKRNPHITPPAYAAQHITASLAAQFTQDPHCSLRSALVTANDGLRQAVTQAVGTFDAPRILADAAPWLADDPRNVRLVLPACVITLLRLHLAERRLELASLGDTSLVELRRDGQAIRHTQDQMGLYDHRVLRAASDLQRQHQLPHFRAAIRHPDIAPLKLEAGLRHNFVDQQGRTAPGDGCGVIDGLPEMEDYIQLEEVTVDTAQTAGLLLISDGMELLAKLNESHAAQDQRLRRMGQLVSQSGLAGLYEKIGTMAAMDEEFDRYPRVKQIDDATGIYLALEA